jgi:hypothetical protein
MAFEVFSPIEPTKLSAPPFSWIKGLLAFVLLREPKELTRRTPPFTVVVPWIVETEPETARLPEPFLTKPTDVDAGLDKRFPSTEKSPFPPNVILTNPPPAPLKISPFKSSKPFELLFKLQTLPNKLFRLSPIETPNPFLPTTLVGPILLLLRVPILIFCPTA